MLNLCLNHIKTGLCNFLNDLTRAVSTETDHAMCPNIEPCPPNGRKSKQFISPHVILALYCLANIIIAFNNFLLGALSIYSSSAAVVQFVLIFLLEWHQTQYYQVSVERFFRGTKQKPQVIYLV